MAIERTYAMIKPDAVNNKNIGEIISRIEQEGFTIIAMKKMQMTKDLAEIFYAVHREKPFFNELVDFVISGPIVAMVLERDNAIAVWRELMGNTDPEKASDSTLRNLYGMNISRNAAHGSDAPDTAETEIELMFPDLSL